MSSKLQEIQSRKEARKETVTALRSHMRRGEYELNRIPYFTTLDSLLLALRS